MAFYYDEIGLYTVATDERVYRFTHRPKEVKFGVTRWPAFDLTVTEGERVKVWPRRFEDGGEFGPRTVSDLEKEFRSMLAEIDKWFESEDE